jgi:hypothetical protein
VQDEGGMLDLLNARAMREVEGCDKCDGRDREASRIDVWKDRVTLRRTGSADLLQDAGIAGFAAGVWPSNSSASTIWVRRVRGALLSNDAISLCRDAGARRARVCLQMALS